MATARMVEERTRSGSSTPGIARKSVNVNRLPRFPAITPTVNLKETKA
jgi:hypothetical protein